MMEEIGWVKEVVPDMKILEIGTGIGWLPIICKMKGLSCKGIEISPQLVEYGRQFGRYNGVEPDIELGNIEDCDIDEATYHVIFAFSVFEHVKHWQGCLHKIYRA